MAYLGGVIDLIHSILSASLALEYYCSLYIMQISQHQQKLRVLFSICFSSHCREHDFQRMF